MDANNWEQLSQLPDLQSVIDPHDTKGSKNLLIDQIQWNALRKHLHLSQNILDYGCGIGRFAKRVHAMGKQYIGIDTSLGMINKASGYSGDQNFKHFNGIKIPIPSASVDTVITSDVLTYILKSPAGAIAISEIHRVLTNNGRLIMIEQASISGRKSENASTILTEDDYRSALEDKFRIVHSYKVRSPDFSELTCKILDTPKVPFKIFRWMVPYVARHEASLVRRAPKDYFTKTSYYDFLMEAHAINHKQ